MPLTKITLTRRGLLAGAAIACLPLKAFALAESRASSYVQGVIDDVLTVINSNRTEAQMLARFERVFTSYADINIIARSVLGPARRSASASQQRAFAQAFGHYLSYKYGRQFREYRGATITIVQTRDAGRKGVLVKSMVRKVNESPFELEWWVSDGSGQIKLIDLIIEGISLLASEREEIRNKLAAHRGDIDALTAELTAV